MSKFNFKVQSAVLGAFFVLSISLLSFTSCGKEKVPDPVPQTAVELIAGGNSKTWGIEKLYVNDTLIALNADQLRYTKTYKRDSTYADSDGVSGLWCDCSENLNKVKRNKGQSLLI